ncbi:MAG: alpha/beta fold hydrolase [Bacteroidota bacterium]
MMQKGKVTGNFGELNYSIYPGGSKALFAFHGFGQKAGDLEPVIKQLRREYTTYSFNHFFHGSKWIFKNQPLKKLLWKDILKKVIQKHRIDTFDMLGFSLGAKIALTSFELFPDKVKKMHLLAPDGIETNIWYNLATYPSIFRRYFKSMIVHPKRFYSIINGLNQLGLVDKGLMRFATSQMDTASKRHRVYFSWIVYKDFKSPTASLTQRINERTCELNFWLGKYDRVISKKGIESFAQGLREVKLTTLDCGHNDLINKVAFALSD